MFLLVLFSLRSNAQIVFGALEAGSIQDTSKKTAPPKKHPKKFAELIKMEAVSDSGLFNIYQQEGRFFFELQNSMLNKELLIVSRISRSAAELRNPQSMLGYGGDQIGSTVVSFDKGPDHKLFMRTLSYSERTDDSTKQMYRSLMNSTLQPIAASFEIKGFSKKDDGVIIDITDYLNGDNDILFFNSGIKSVLKISSLQADRSYILSVKSFPENVEIRTVKTYIRSAGTLAAGTSAVAGGMATLELNTSIVMLPEKPMLPRKADTRIGYFSTGYTDYGNNLQGIEKVSLITRWRLEPKAEDVKKYLNGVLVEPKKQIVFYIDPATPKAWVPYLMQGVNDWNEAFEAAGFKNAISAKIAPTAKQDPEWGLEDARHSAIVYKSSEVPNASGPHVNDPRTGEILESHVNWYHNVMKLLRNWYFIQASAIDPEARTPKFKEELMGQLIRFVSSHEVGHTLGLRHNYGSSSTVPTEKLRDKKWVKEHGHTPSIMDYARFNYVAQPEDKVSQKDIFPRINDYDKWAIEWGYRWYPENRFKTEDEEKAYLNKWIIEKTIGNKRLWFGTETDKDDPRSQSEDLGDDAALASSYGIKNLQRVLPNLLKWTKEDNESYETTAELYGELVNQFNRYMGHVVKNIGGVMTSPKSVEEPGAVIAFIPKQKQQRAMEFLNRELFDTPTWLLNKELFDKTGKGTTAMISNLQNTTLDKLLSVNTLSKLGMFESYDLQAAYTQTDMFRELQNGVFSELKTNHLISIYRRNLQKMYTEKLMKLLKAEPMKAGVPVLIGGPDPELTDISSIAKAQLRKLELSIKQALPQVTDEMTISHLKDLDERINKFFKDTTI
jgi:hypothetical protein